MTRTTGRLLDSYSPRHVLGQISGPGALTGVQALGRLLIDQRRADIARGWRTAGLASGYRGSPLAGLDIVLERNSELLAEHDIKFIPGVNEELGATVVYGSQLAPQLPSARYDGVFGMWYGKAPGVDRAMDAFKHGTWMGTTPRGGVLVVAGDDPACKSSTLPSNSTMALAEAYLPVLAPVDVADVLRLGRFGFEMSRFTGSWVGFTVVTNVCDAYEVVELGIEPEIRAPELEWNARPWQATFKPGVTIPEAIALEHEVLDGRLAAARAFAAANRLDRIEGAVADARIGLVSSGHNYVQLREALDQLGLDEDALHRRGVRMLRLGLVYPIDRGALLTFADGLDEIVVVEDKRAFIELQVKDILYNLRARPRVYGKHGPDGTTLIPVHGSLEADRIIVSLGKLLADRLGSEHVDLRHAALRPTMPALTLTPLTRTPYFCSGCPHNRSTQIPQESIAGSGIGCHAMTTFMERSIGFTQMGGEGASWVGAEPFTDMKHFFQNLGDGTFFHSGSLAVRQAVSAGSNITFKLLYNDAVAMTGGQHADGAVDPVAISWMLHSEGVARTVIVTDDPAKYPRATEWAPGVKTFHRDELEAVQRDLSAIPGVTVLLYDQACAAEKRRKRKRGELPDPAQRVFINEAVCEGCGDCGKKSNCLSVEPVDTEFGRKTQINQTTCNKDYSCLLGDCPSFLTVLPADRPTQMTERLKPAGDLPEPDVLPGEANLVMVGIGGTGVVTTNQVLTTAALLSGLEAHALDQTGLSQKAGAVVSHLRIGPACVDRPGMVSAGTADGYLVFDALAATAEANLIRCDAERTVAVVSTSEVPTGTMIADPSASYPARGTLLRRISQRTLARDLIALDALTLAQRLFDNTAAANFLIVGAAYQKGLLPVSAQAIERAIELNGVGVADTVQAFRAGRKAVLEPHWLAAEPTVAAAAPAGVGHTVAAARELVRGSGTHGELRRLLDIRVSELAEYQNLDYAKRYLDTVTGIEAAARKAGATDSALAEAVARNLYKLMAYKDEYEVARLHLDPELDRQVRERFGAGARVRYQLHPPVLRALGIKRKMSFGRTGRPMFRVLRAMRGLRGTVADPFGYAKVRRVERALVAEYLGVVRRLVEGLALGNHDLAVQIAELPDMVRGYEEVKLATIGAYHAKLQDLLALLDSVK